MERQNNSSITNSACKQLCATLADFDFDRVRSVMKYLKWTWLSTNNQIPEKWDIHDAAFKMLIDCYHKYWDDTDRRENPYYIRSGGLEASYEYIYDIDVEDDQRDCFSLKFVLVESTNNFY